MSALTQVRAQAVADAEAAAGTTFRLMTANGSQAAAGTELATSGGYTAGTGIAVTFDAALVATGTYSATKASQACSQTNMPASTIVGIETWLSAVRRFWGALTASKTLAAGDTLSFPAASVVISV
jgi:hypothetical protein